MKHYTLVEWEAYVTEQLSAKSKTSMERHLYTCDDCLEQYTKAIETSATSDVRTVTPQWNENWTDELMDAIQRMNEGNDNRIPPIKKNVLFRPLFQYSIAAAITSVIMFTSLFLQMDTMQPIMIETEQKETITDHLMKRTISLIDSIYPYER